MTRRRERVDDQDGTLHRGEHAMRLRSRSCVAAHAVEQEGVEAVGKLIGIRPRPKPGVGPVRRRQGEQRRGRVVEIRPQPAELAPFAEERAEAVLVAPALGEELVAPFALEVAPLANEDRRDLELLGDDPQVRAQREPDLLGRRQRPPARRRGRRGRRPRRRARPPRAGPPSSRCGRRASPSGRPSPRPGRRSTCRGSPSRRRAAPPRA